MNTQLAVSNNPKTIPITRGAGWLFEGFNYFTESPLSWIVAMVLLFVIAVAMMLVPFIGVITLNLLMPVFMAGLMLGCHAQAQGEKFSPQYLFAGFSKNTRQLIVLGLFYMLGIGIIGILLAVITQVVFGGTTFGGIVRPENLQNDNLEIIKQNFKITLPIILMTPITLALYIPLLMAYWFAPALVVFADVPPVDALKKSFIGCLINILPFIVYGIVGLLLLAIAIIPFGLGLLILWPMLIASIYIAYCEIFNAKVRTPQPRKS